MEFNTTEETHKKSKEYSSSEKIADKYKKTLICISDIGDKGKTTTANEVINILRGYVTATVLLHTNYRRQQQTEQFIVRIGNQTIGVDCIGDPNTNFPTRIDSLGVYPWGGALVTVTAFS